MADATTAARARIDRALAELERKILELKARPASAPRIGDDDLFAPKSADPARVAELEAAGREASQALARAAEAVREVLAQDDLAQDDLAQDDLAQDDLAQDDLAKDDDKTESEAG